MFCSNFSIKCSEKFNLVGLKEEDGKTLSFFFNKPPLDLFLYLFFDKPLGENPRSAPDQTVK